MYLDGKLLTEFSGIRLNVDRVAILVTECDGMEKLHGVQTGERNGKNTGASVLAGL